jgi:hypothetical protein
MGETGVLLCSRETFAAYQEILLGLDSSNIDDIVGKFNEDSTWAAPCSVAQVVAAVAGSRRNGAELIEFMRKISSTRGYSAVLEQLEKLIAGISVEEVTNVIIRGCQKSVDMTKRRSCVVAEVYSFLDSGAFQWKAEIGTLERLFEAIKDPLGEGHGNHEALREAMKEVSLSKFRFWFTAVAVVAADTALKDVAAPLEESTVDKETLQLLPRLFETVKEKIDDARGFSALDADCAAARFGSALDVFKRLWGIFRGTAHAPVVDPFVEVIVAGVVKRLEKLIGRKAPLKIEVDPEKFPVDFPRRPRLVPASLLEIAGAVGGDALSYLLDDRQCGPDYMVLEQAIASGNAVAIQRIWDLLSATERVESTWPLIASIAFHRPDVAKWLASEHPQWLGVARRIAREKRAFDALLHLPEGEEELSTLEGLVGKYATALEQLGIPLACVVEEGSGASVSKPEIFEREVHGGGQRLLVMEGDDGRAFGALIAVPWPSIWRTGKDIWCRSFLFTLDGESATRFSATTPPVFFHDEEKVCVGELRLVWKEKAWRYSVDGQASCTGGQFPEISGKVASWQICGF